MSAFRWWSAVVLALAVVAGAVLFLQRQSAAQLREEVALLREDNARLAGLRVENARLLAAQLPATELERLRSDRAAVIRFRGEIEKVKTGLDERERVVRLPAKTMTIEPESAPVVQVLSAAKLKNAGVATPLAALETVLWSGRTGHVDELMKLLMFDRASAQRAQAMFDALPVAEQKNYGGSFRLVAALMAKDMSTGDVRVTEVRSTDPEPVSVKLDVELQSAAGGARTARLEFKKYDNRWGLWVPENSVAGIATVAGGTPAK